MNNIGTSGFESTKFPEGAHNSSRQNAAPSETRSLRQLAPRLDLDSRPRTPERFCQLHFERLLAPQFQNFGAQ